MSMWVEAEGMLIPWLGERLPEGVSRSELIDPPPLPFALLLEDLCFTVFLWLVENVTVAADGVFVNQRLAAATGISLTETQLEEALLLLGMDPWDTEDGWVYRVHKDCPAASFASHHHVASAKLDQ